MTIHCVWEIRPRPEGGGVGAAAVAAPVIRSAIRGKACRAAAQRRVTETVGEVQGEPDGQPDAESLPRGAWQAPHHEDAGRRTAEAHGPRERDAEGTRPVW